MSMTAVMHSDRDELEIVREHSTGTPVDIAALIHDLGVHYSELPMGPGESGRIERRGNGYAVLVNGLKGQQRRRFTAAHEVAHYLLHRDLLDERGHLDRLFSEEGGVPGSALTPEHEVQANRLAADLLMPGHSVRHWRGVAPTLSALAETFDVSPAAMRIRMRTLRLPPYTA